ncbi:MAG TPA: sulfatase [Candidatus Hydrogenedens sp.]|nr:sulfatase [Candidatus Hydrogenedens sp.]
MSSSFSSKTKVLILFFLCIFFHFESNGSIVRLSEKYWSSKAPTSNLIIDDRQWVRNLEKESTQIVYEYKGQIDLSLYKFIKIEVSSKEAAFIRWGWAEGNTNYQTFFSSEKCSLVPDSKYHTYSFVVKFPDKINPLIGKTKKIIIEISNVKTYIDEVQLKNVEFIPYITSELGQLMINGLCIDFVSEKKWVAKVNIQKGDRLQFYTGIYNPEIGALPQKQEQNSWDIENIEFSIDLQLPDKNENIYRYQMNPVEKEDDREWRFAELDLTKYAENSVQILFSMKDSKALTNAYGVWGNPIIMRNNEKNKEEFPSVFIISCDALRPDHLLPYGYSLPTSPNLDKFAKDAVLFELAYTPRTFTPVAHMSLLTGLYPKNHGVNAELPAFEHVKLLSEYLRNLGYYSIGLVGATTWFLPSRGYTRGIDEFYYPPEYLRDVFTSHEILKNRINKVQYDNLFVFLHNYDIHGKMLYPGIIYSSDDSRFCNFSDMYDIPQSLSAECMPYPRIFFNYIQNKLGKLGFFENLYIRALYDDCVAKVDFALGDLFNYLKEKKLYDKSFICVVSDHGEALGEHGRYEHVDVYEHTARATMMIKFPNNMHAGKRVYNLVSLEDITPTVLDYLKIGYKDLDGISLFKIIEGTYNNPRKFFIQNQFQNEEALVSETHKLIRSFRESKISFFNLVQDPSESIDISEKEGPLMEQFLAEMNSYKSFDGDGWIISVKKKNTKVSDEILICPGTNLVSVCPENIMFWYKKAESMDCLYGTLSYPQISNMYSLYIYPKEMNQELRIGFKSSERFKALLPGGLSESVNEYEFLLPKEGTYWESKPNLPEDENIYVFIQKKTSVLDKKRKEVGLSEEAVESLRSTGYLD